MRIRQLRLTINFCSCHKYLKDEQQHFKGPNVKGKDFSVCGTSQSCDHLRGGSKPGPDCCTNGGFPVELQRIPVELRRSGTTRYSHALFVLSFTFTLWRHTLLSLLLGGLMVTLPGSWWLRGSTLSVAVPWWAKPTPTGSGITLTWGWWEGKPCWIEARTFTGHLLLSLWFILKVVLVDPTMPTHLPSQMSPPHPHPCNKWGEAVPDKKILTHVTKYSQQDKFLPCLLDSHPAEELFNQVARSSG